MGLADIEMRGSIQKEKKEMSKRCIHNATMKNQRTFVLSLVPD